ncbi:hypothetical protein IMZ48_11780 [Candidatus Bathyarchaeota archaeon]|nr:hypothetical protein [Candidatus Bathyarchaeota archaeon]
MDFPVYDSDYLSTNNSVNSMAPFFRQDFWTGPVKVYGLKALKMHTVSHKMKATMSSMENISSHCHIFYDGIENARKSIETHLEALEEHDLHVAVRYLKALIVERSRLHIGIVRWEAQEAQFKARSEREARNLRKAHTIALEAHLYRHHLKMKVDNSPGHKMREFAVDADRRWKNAVSRLPGGKPPKGSEALAGIGPDWFLQRLEIVVTSSGCRRYLASLPDVSAYMVDELQHLEQGIFEVYMMDESDMQHMLSRFRQRWFNNIDSLTRIARKFITDMSAFQGHHSDIGAWMTRFIEMSQRCTLLKQYLTTDQKKLNPVTWRQEFLTIGKGNAARKTPSKNWANLMREQLSNMPTIIRTEFEWIVGIVMTGTGSPAPHEVAQTMEEQYSGATTIPPEAPGLFDDLVNEVGEDEDQIAAEALLALSQTPGFNPNDGQALKAIVQHSRAHAGRRRQTQSDIQQLQGDLNVMRHTLLNDNEAYQAREAVFHAKERRAELERKIMGLQKLQMQHHHLHEYDNIHAEINVYLAMLEEMLDEVNLRELHSNRLLEDPAVRGAREFEQRLLQAEIENYRDTERRTQAQELARIAEEQRQRGSQVPNALGLLPKFRSRFPPTLEDDMVPLDLHKRKRGSDDGPAAKRPRFRAEALKTLIEDPPFIGGPVRIEGRPLPLDRSDQLEMPYGGLPEVRYPIEPLKVRGEAAVCVVERMADAVERWGEMGVRSRYEVPKGAVEALYAVASSERSGLPTEPGDWAA